MASAVKGTCSPVKIEKTTLADRVWISEYHVASELFSEQENYQTLQIIHRNRIIFIRSVSFFYFTISLKNIEN